MKKLLLAIVVFLGACGEDRPAAPSAPPPPPPSPADVFEALPTDVQLNREKVVLGRALFHDTRLSGDNTISCSSCHSLDMGGAEHDRTSTGIRGQVGPINSPTVLNAVYNFRQFWDGRAADLLEQAAGPVTNPIEMGGDWPTILERLRADQALAAQFTAVYGQSGVTQANVLDAIVEYERSLVTPSRFDRYLRGEQSALDAQEQRGMSRFIEAGCTTCHRGRNIGGDSYQKMGLLRSYFELRGGELTEADNGRFNVTHQESDRHFFKVPTLRNVEHTAPYFHDGSHATLPEAVRTMGRVQLNRELSDADVADIVAFLRSLSGEIPADARMPAAPAAPPAEGTAPAAPAEGTTAPAAPAQGAAPAAP
ncbi:MAG: cytochrome-c peroxidase [Sandaracinaceae bacterium]|nr:cytochrome-c peroxidase [Sandaracinaceae bacterium]